MKMGKLLSLNVLCSFSLILLHSERPKLYSILAFLSAIGFNHDTPESQKQWRLENFSLFPSKNYVVTSYQYCLTVRWF